MAKKKKSQNVSPSLHVKLSEEDNKKLRAYAEARDMALVDVIRYALTRLYSIEDVDPKKTGALQAAIESMFVVPGKFEIVTFWIVLYMLSQQYPTASSRKFWGPAVYVDVKDRTHKEVVEDIFNYEKGQK